MGKVVSSRYDPRTVQEHVRKLVPMDIAPAVFGVNLTGHRCIVRRAAAQTESSGVHGISIIIPEAAQRPVAAGYIINVGPAFADPDYAPEKGPNFAELVESPWDMIGQYVLFGDWVGQDLKVDCLDRKYETEFLILQEWELWGTVEEYKEDEANTSD